MYIYTIVAGVMSRGKKQKNGSYFRSENSLLFQAGHRAILNFIGKTEIVHLSSIHDTCILYST